MTETLATPAGATTPAVPDTGTGPIVVAIGGVDPDSVLRAARILERHAAGGVIAAVVAEPPPAALVGAEPMLIPPEFLDARREERRVELAERLQRFGGSALTWRTAVLDGEPAFAIDDLARRLNAPLIVMGLGRHGALDRVFGTETTLRAIRLARCAVLAVHPDLDAPFRDVVVATDFSAASAYAAQQAVALLDPGAVVHVVHVWQPTGSSDARTAEADEVYRRSLDERFARFTRLLALPSGVELRTVAREGKAAERVLDYAAAHRADLVVAGRHGLNAFERIIVGSQTTALLRAAARSILVAPEPPQPLRDRLRLALTGATRSTDPDDWALQLRDFTARNRGRRAVLDVEDLLFAAKVTETGFVFREAAYDEATKRVDLTLGDPDHDARRVTRTVGVVDSIEVTAAPDGMDLCLRIAHGGGETALTFSDG
jgi:nucleotide-binding universal stress UspA family protein